ncbi:MAG: c-type cytochrome [Gammaproteobacteria bacterium]|nr:c-type cytochrome [Gammaproteobacteria bacterium]
MIRGLNKQYFVEQLTKYKSGERIQENGDPDKSGEMNELMAEPSIDDQVINGLAEHYASMERLPLDEGLVGKLDKADREMFQGGRTLFDGTCMACHGAQGIGIPQSPMPHLAGQIALYTEKRLQFYATQSGSGSAAIMTGILKQAALTDQDIKHIAFYLENVVGKR